MKKSIIRILRMLGALPFVLIGFWILGSELSKKLMSDTPLDLDLDDEEE